VSNLDYSARWATRLWKLLSELAGFNTAASSATKNDHPCPVTRCHMKLAMLDGISIQERTSTSSPAFPRAAEKLTLLDVSARKLLHDN